MIGNNPERNKAIGQLLRQGAKNERMVLWALSFSVIYAYRVLLTRARQGIVICVPAGNDRITPEGFPEDATRLPEFYNGTYEYLKSLGIEEL